MWAANDAASKWDPPEHLGPNYLQHMRTAHTLQLVRVESPGVVDTVVEALALISMLSVIL